MDDRDPALALSGRGRIVSGAEIPLRRCPFAAHIWCNDMETTCAAACWLVKQAETLTREGTD